MSDAELSGEFLAGMLLGFDKFDAHAFVRALSDRDVDAAQRCPSPLCDMAKCEQIYRAGNLIEDWRLETQETADALKINVLFAPKAKLEHVRVTVEVGRI
jgi:hypothetical protein